MRNIDKKQVREQVIKLRDSQSEDKILSKSKIIKDELFDFEYFKKSNIIMFYVSFRSEVKTDFIIKESLKLGKKVVLPQADPKNKKLNIFQVTNFEEDLKEGIWGILEPKDACKKIDIKNIDLVIVPAVAYDMRGYRVGYGGGYYDKFLSEFYNSNKNGKTIGLAYELQIIDKIPADEFDQKVNFIVTEERINYISPFTLP